MTLEEMKRVKKERGYSFRKLSDLSGVPVSTIQKIWGGKTRTPRSDTLEALAAVLGNALQDKRQGEFTIHDYEALTGEEYQPIELIDGKIYGVQHPYAHVVREGSAAYKPITESGSYTEEDLERVRRERNVELIDGSFYEMASPSGVHQTIEMGIILAVHECMKEHGGACTVTGPRDVQLFPDDEKSVFIPDVVILCDQKKEHNQRIVGAPDLVMEILSPSTAVKDKTIKLRGYELAGVREVWIINPKTRQIVIHDFEHDDKIRLYGFGDTVPVGISGGRCRIDFNSIADRLCRIFGEDWQ